MTEMEIDLLLGCTPCICGTEDTWHGACYAGKTKEQVEAAYRRVYAKIRKRLRRERIEALAQAIDAAQTSGDNE